MLTNYQTHIIQVGNSKGVRIPKSYLDALGTGDVILEQVENGIMIRPVTTPLPPRAQWAAIMAKMKAKKKDTELQDWDITLSDGLEDL